MNLPLMTAKGPLSLRPAFPFSPRVHIREWNTSISSSLAATRPVSNCNSASPSPSPAQALNTSQQLPYFYIKFLIVQRVVVLFCNSSNPEGEEMASVYRLHTLSHSSFSLPCFQNTHKKLVNFTPYCSIRQRTTSSTSPFTEKHSIERYQRDSWVYTNQIGSNRLSSFGSPPAPSYNSSSIREDDIELQLPELKKLLQVLKEKREIGDGAEGKQGPGNVFLVGTGPGDPELLTLKAVKAIQSADLLLYDRLVSNDVLDLVGPNARLLYVGKTAGYHSRTQEEIHDLLLSFAEVGATVVRLKGGDPLVFGRGGEEMDFLLQQGIVVKVIPGITAASGIGAELGIPLTHRGVANSVRFLTGHSRKGGSDPLYVAENAADPDSTLVVYMGLSTLPSIAQKLMHHGLASTTPAVAVERGTTPQQRVVFAELHDLADKIAEAGLVSPTLIIIGKVVALSPLWFNSHEEPLRVEAQGGHNVITS